MTSVAVEKYKLTPLRALANMVSRRPAVFVGLIAFGMYLSTLTANSYWDGLAFAGIIERVATHDHGRANQTWNERTVIFSTDDGPVDGAFRYFNVKTEWRAATRKALMRLDDEIDKTYAQGGSVWLNNGAVAAVESDWLADRAYGDVINVEMGDTTYRYVQVLRARSSPGGKGSSASR